MGRIYSGDISGKFWFAEQASEDASFFGGEAFELIGFDFDKFDRNAIDAGIRRCYSALGEYEVKLRNHFSVHEFYNDGRLAATLGVSVTALAQLLAWYARLELGKKIRECVDRTGKCSFIAEC